MGGNMVEKSILGAKESYEIIEKFFLNNFPEFKLILNENYSGYWVVKYTNNYNVYVDFEGDISGVFYVYVIIEDTKYSLWMFDKTVNNKNLSTKENILYQLNVLVDFFL